MYLIPAKDSIQVSFNAVVIWTFAHDRRHCACHKDHHMREIPQMEGAGYNLCGLPTKLSGDRSDPKGTELSLTILCARGARLLAEAESCQMGA
jgi:hypothetical protein